MKKPAERKVKFAVSSAYKPAWEKYSKAYPEIKETLTEFNEAKRKIPPARLPDKMRDHVLDGKLKGIRECHLAPDVLMLYTHKDDVVTLLLVCQHDDIKGDKGKETAKTIARLSSE
jgi:addiction module RelE/StbE family toxin